MQLRFCLVVRERKCVPRSPSHRSYYLSIFFFNVARASASFSYGFGQIQLRRKLALIIRTSVTSPDDLCPLHQLRPFRFRFGWIVAGARLFWTSLAKASIGRMLCSANQMRRRQGKRSGDVAGGDVPARHLSPFSTLCAVAIRPAIEPLCGGRVSSTLILYPRPSSHPHLVSSN